MEQLRLANEKAWTTLGERNGMMQKEIRRRVVGEEEKKVCLGACVLLKDGINIWMINKLNFM